MIVDDLREHLRITTRYADACAREVHGRPVAQLSLLHVNEATAAVLPRYLEDLEADGWRLIGLHEALDDPIYGLPEAVFQGGPSWLYRVPRDRVRHADSWGFGDEEDRVVARFGPPPGPGE